MESLAAKAPKIDLSLVGSADGSIDPAFVSHGETESEEDEEQGLQEMKMYIDRIDRDFMINMAPLRERLRPHIAISLKDEDERSIGGINI